MSSSKVIQLHSGDIRFFRGMRDIRCGTYRQKCLGVGYSAPLQEDICSFLSLPSLAQFSLQHKKKVSACLRVPSGLPP